MSYNYEQSIWGRGTASLRPGDPTSIRLRQALRVLEPVPDAASVLEVGCGAGQFMRAIKQVRQELGCFGCDISVAALQQAKQAGDGVTYTQNDENALPYPDASMEMVLIFDVLEHVQNPERFLKEIYRVLKPGGLLYAFVPCEDDWLSLWHLLRSVGVGKDLTKKYAGHVNYFSRKSLRKLLIDCQFDIFRVSYSEHFLGQWLGVITFFLMDWAAKRVADRQMNNETYFAQLPKSKLLSSIKLLVNTLVYVESVVWSWLPSPNVHVTARK